MAPARRALGALCIVLVAVVCLLAGRGAALPEADASTAALPPTLVALEHKMGELKITSMRFSMQTSITLPAGARKATHVKKLLKFLKLLGFGSQSKGELVVSPPAGNFAFDFLGTPFTVRLAAGRLYMYVRKLARVDHGRPWVRLGPDGLLSLMPRGHRQQPDLGPTELGAMTPKLATPGFTGLQTMLSEAREVSELGPGAVAGQPVTRFLAVLEPSQLASMAPKSTAQLPTAQLPTPQANSTSTLEVSITSAGLPARMVLVNHAGGTTVSVTIRIPAVNFPLVIKAPAPTRTITVPQLRKLERRAKRRRGAHRP